MPKSDTLDPAMVRVREWIDQNKPKLAELGLKMRFDAATARQAAFQFLKSKDPRISTLRRFAEAAGIPIEELVAGPKRAGKEKK